VIVDMVSPFRMCWGNACIQREFPLHGSVDRSRSARHPAISSEWPPRRSVRTSGTRAAKNCRSAQSASSSRAMS